MVGRHPSHRTRFSDASSFDEVCVLCGARDALGTWGTLALECKATDDERAKVDRMTSLDVKSLQLNHLEKDDIIQIVPSHKWGGCLAVVDEPKSFGCQCYVSAPLNGPNGIATARYYIRLNWDEFERINAKPIFILADEPTPSS